MQSEPTQSAMDGADIIQGEGKKRFLTLPPAWPLACLMLPLQHSVRQMEILLQCYCYETIAMCKDPEQQGPYVKRLAKDLVQFLALFLAETVAELLQAVLAYPSKGLVDASNAPLLTHKFWVQAIEQFANKRKRDQQQGFAKFFVYLTIERWASYIKERSHPPRPLRLYSAVPVEWTRYMCGFLPSGCRL